MSRFNETNWKLMLIERKRLSDTGEKFSMVDLLRKHHISHQWAPFINSAIEHFQSQKRVNLATPKEFFLHVRTMRENYLESRTEATKEVEINPLEKASLEDLISELNSRGWKVYQA